MYLPPPSDFGLWSSPHSINLRILGMLPPQQFEFGVPAPSPQVEDRLSTLLHFHPFPQVGVAEGPRFFHLPHVEGLIEGSLKF